MPIECPQCKRMNAGTATCCYCGQDLSALAEQAEGVTQVTKSRVSLSILAAWFSPFAGIVIAIILDKVHFPNNHRGERPHGELAFYETLFWTSVVGGLVGIISPFAIPSRRHALFIIPGALLGICINGYNAFMCFLSYALVGVNIGG